MLTLQVVITILVLTELQKQLKMQLMVYFVLNNLSNWVVEI